MSKLAKLLGVETEIDLKFLSFIAFKLSHLINLRQRSVEIIVQKWLTL